MRPRPTDLTRLPYIASLIVLWSVIALGGFASTRASERAAKAIFVPGTSVGMRPPPGFTLSSAFSGFENPETRSGFLIIEFPAEAYQKMAAGLTDEALAGSGVSVTARRKVEIDGARGLSLTGTQAIGGRNIDKWMLLLGSKSVTVMVTAQDLSGQGLDDGTVRQAFSTIRFRPALSLAQKIAASPIDVGTLAGFRITQTVMGLGLVLTKGAKDIVRDASQPVVIVTRPIGAGYPTNAGPGALSVALLRAVETVRLISADDMVKSAVAGGDGYEQSAKARDIKTGKPVTVTQWLYLKPDQQLRMVAVVPTDQQARLLPDLRAVAAGLRLR